MPASCEPGNTSAVFVLCLQQCQSRDYVQQLNLQCAEDMTADDFTAAQQRIATRHQVRLFDAQNAAARRNRQTASIQSRTPILIPGIDRGLSIWNQLKDGGGTRPAYRVGQLDSELLDEELLELLKGQIGEGLKLFGVSGIFQQVKCSETD